MVIYVGGLVVLVVFVIGMFVYWFVGLNYVDDLVIEVEYYMDRLCVLC